MGAIEEGDHKSPRVGPVCVLQDRQPRERNTRLAASADVTGQEPRTQSKASGLIEW